MNGFPPEGLNDEDWRVLAKAGAGDWQVLVRSTNPDDDMVRPPADWEQVGDLPNVKIWRPIPPEGYKIFSDFGANPSEDPRTGLATIVACVKETHDGFTYAHPADVAQTEIENTWRVIAPDYWYGTNGIRITATSQGGFCYSTEGKPVDQLPMHVLNLPIDTQHGTEPQKPLMDSFSKPVDVTDWARERVIAVPFPAVKDSDKSMMWQVQNSPTYTLQRDAQYKLEKYIDNEHSSTELSVGYSVTKGVTETQTETWNAKVGVSVTAKGGIDIKVFKAEVSATVSVELGYSSATSVSEMINRTDTGALKTPGRHAGAMYSVNHRLTAFREDGIPVGGEASNLTFTPNQDYYFVQYPEADSDKNSVEKLSRAASPR